MRVFIIFLVSGILVGCSNRSVIREHIEWSDFRWEHEGDNILPRVLFIGNSILRGYFPEVSAQLSAVANCDRYSTSRSITDPALFRETKMAMGKYRHSVVHFNNGLHGWHLTNEQYEKGLRKFVRVLKKNKSGNCQLVYSLTTPVSSIEAGIKLDAGRNNIVLARNRIARNIMEENNIPVIDLYALMEPELDTYVVRKGDLHYKNEGYKRMAEKISQKIATLLR